MPMAIQVTAITGGTIDLDRDLRFVKMTDGAGGEFALALTSDLLDQLLSQCLSMVGQEQKMPDGPALMVLPTDGSLALTATDPGRVIVAHDLSNGLRLAFDLPAGDARALGEALARTGE